MNVLNLVSKYKRTAVAVAVAALLGGTTVGVAVTNTGPFAPCSAPHNFAAIGVKAFQDACPAPADLGVTVAGNQLDTTKGTKFVPQGVNRSGTEYMCIGSNGGVIFDGPSNAASVAAMKTWNVNIVRVQLNEDCWLGINGADTIDGITVAQYQTAIENYVTLLNHYGIDVVLDLQWTAPGTILANAQTSMADADHSITFWSQVATQFRHNPSVLFDLYNEPINVDWPCWLNGCLETTQYGSQTYGNYQTAGMQQMLNAVRATGATNVVLAGGIAFANDVSQWLTFKPADPLNQLAVSTHDYEGQTCSTVSCWNSQILPDAAVVPVVALEFGEQPQIWCTPSNTLWDGTDFNPNGNGTAWCTAARNSGVAAVGQFFPPSSTFALAFMAWADTNGIGYVAWTWDAWGCAGGPVLIADYTGARCGGPPTGDEGFSVAVYNRYTGSSSPPPTTTTTAPGSFSWLNVTPSTVTTNFNTPCAQCNYGFDQIAIDPTTSALFVGTDYSGLWKSTDQGGSWTKIDTGTNSNLLDEGRLWNVAIDPLNHNNIYVSSGYGAGGPLRSTDGGVDWTLLPSPNPTTNDTHSISLDPYLANHLIVAYHYFWNGNQDSGVSESFDHGSTWTQHNPPAGAGAGNAAWILDNSHTWLFNTQNGVWRTTDSGTTWTQVISTTGAHGSDNALSGNFATGHLILANGTQILQSNDDGVTWTNIGDSSNGLPFAFFQNVVSDGTNYYTSPNFPIQSYQDGTIYSRPVSGGNWAVYGTTKTCYTDTSGNGPNCNGMNLGVYDSVNHVAYTVNLLGGVWKHSG